LGVIYDAGLSFITNKGFPFISKVDGMTPIVIAHVLDLSLKVFSVSAAFCYP